MMTHMIPVTSGLFPDDGEVALLGSACPACGAHFFPRRTHCPNPPCCAGSLQDARFGRRGTLYSYTVQAYRPPPLFRMDDWQPYAIGLVELTEGLRVLAMLTGVALSELRIGIPLELVLDPLYRDTEGREVLTYKYRPLSGERLR